MNESRWVAFATSADKKVLNDGDQLAVDALARRGVIAVPAVWNDPNEDWTRFDAVIIRSTWDYTQKFESFIAWLKHLENLQIRVMNPLQTLLWNSDKRYLIELSRKGVTIPQTFLLSDANGLELALQELNSEEAVIKPTISAGGRDTWRISRGDLKSRLGREYLESIWAKGSPALLQAFQSEILTKGEFSLIYFSGKFSHAIVKKAKPGEFRIQSKYGGSVTPFAASPELVRAAAEVFTQVPCGENLHYARVDCLLSSKGEWMLMGLELIEPDLFMDQDPNAPEKFADALVGSN